MKLSKSVKPISYLKAHASELIHEVAETHQPLVITHHGEAKVIVQDLESYEKMQDSLALLKILALSQKDKAEGRVKPLEEAFKSIRQRIRDEE